MKTLHKNTFRKVDFNGARGLVFLGEKMLAYRRDYNTTVSPGRIDYPGGGREGDESPFETFRREVWEEFGITIREDEMEFSCTIPSVANPQQQSFFMVARTIRYTSDDIVFGDEGLEWFLMTPEEFVQRPDGIERLQTRVAQWRAGELMCQQV